MKNHKGFIPIVIVVVITIIAGILVGTGWWYQNKSDERVSLNKDTNTNTALNSNADLNTNNTTNTNTTVNTNTPTPVNAEPQPQMLDDTSDWQTYMNDAFDYSFMYPPDTQVNEYDDSGSVRLISTNDPNKDSGRYIDGIGPGPIGILVSVSKPNDIRELISSQVGGNLEPTQTTIFGMSAYTVSGKLSEGEHRVPGAKTATVEYYYFQKGDRFWKVEFDSGDIDIVPTYDQFKTLLSTFQFTN